MADLSNDHLISFESALKQREQLRKDGKRLVVTNGCFDLLHVGHISYLKASRALGDALWVLINSDRSVKRLKGELRPIESETDRAYCLAALECVDRVVIFEGDDLQEELEAIRPDLYTKAGDYTIESLHAGERQALVDNGTEIVFIPFLKGMSTTNQIAKICRAHEGQA